MNMMRYQRGNHLHLVSLEQCLGLGQRQAHAGEGQIAPAPSVYLCEQALLAASCRDGRGRATDNAFIERLWRTVIWDHTYLNPADNGRCLH